MRGVERSLRRLEGVKSVKVDFSTKTAELEVSPDYKFDREAIHQGLRQAGFSVGSVELIGSFTLGEQSGAMAVLLGELGEVLLTGEGVSDLAAEDKKHRLRIRLTVESGTIGAQLIEILPAKE